jgi:hypothetical protein
MAYNGDTIKYRISTENGSYKTVNTLLEVEKIVRNLSESGSRLVTVDMIETTRLYDSRNDLSIPNKEKNDAS